MALTFNVSEIINIYNCYPGLLKDKTTGVSLVQDTSGKANSVLLEKSNNGNYWLLTIPLQNKPKYFLLPQPNVTFSEHKLKYFNKLFTCEGSYDHPKQPFTLDRLAELKLTSIPDQWALVTKGQITFVEELSQVWLLQSQIEHLQTEIANLSNTLNHTQSEYQKSQTTIKEKNQTIENLDKQLKDLRKTYENAWQQSLAEQRATRSDRQVLQGELDQVKQENLNLARQIDFWEDQYKNLQKQLEILLPNYEDMETIGKRLINIAETQKTKLKDLAKTQPFNPFLFTDNIVDSIDLSQQSSKAIEKMSVKTTLQLSSQDENLPIKTNNSLTSPSFDKQQPYDLDSQTIEILKWYQHDQDRPDLLEQYTQKVSETEDSFNARRSALNSPIVLAPASNHSFLIYRDYYMFPRPDAKITNPKLNTFEACFECENFSSGAPFQVLKPAIVFKLSVGDDRWQLQERGKLRFL